MTDSTFGRKSSKKEPNVLDNKNKQTVFGSSLALRIFIINFLFLVLPLLVYCLMMYRYDAALKQSEESRTLELVSDIQTFMMRKLRYLEFQTLELIELYLKEGGLLNTNEIKVKEEGLKGIQAYEGVDNIFVLRKNAKNKISCVLSSGGCDFFTSYDLMFFSPTLNRSDFAVTLEKGAGKGKDKVYFTKVLKRGPQREVLETLNIAVTIQFVMDYLTQAQGYEGIYSVSLFRKDDYVIFGGQDPSLIGKKIQIDGTPSKDEGIINLKSIPKEDSTYRYYKDNKIVYATILPLVYAEFGIFTSKENFVYSEYLREFFYKSIVFFISIIVFGSLGAWILTYLMETPLKRLCAAMTKVGNQDLSARYEASAYGFEINRVGELFNTMIQKLLYNLLELQKQTIKQEKLQQELQIGHQIQKSLVPTEIPEIPGIDIQTVLIPATEVGGDFYDFFINRNNPDELILVMADTAGHGVFGCFYSLTMRSILRSLGSTMTGLEQIIVKANEIFCKDSAETNVFVTTWIGSYNSKTHVLQYSSCGHPLGFLFRNNRLFKELITPGIALGAMEDIKPVMDSVNLQSGDTLILITDGLIETRNPQGELFGKQRFIQVVEQYCYMNMVDLFENLIQELENFEVDPNNQEDDVTMVVIRIR